jgi:crotonobetaine/carnitine-CoA ligase
MTGATVTTMLGGMMQYILAQPPTPGDKDNRLRAVWAVPAPVEVCRDFSERFAVERVATVYGNTEVGTVTDPRDEDLPPGSCGRPDERWFELRIIDPDTDEPVPAGRAGEVVVRPRVPWIVTQGYFGMPERTAEATRNLWFHTGDSLRQDERGYLYFVDRIKDKIRVRGENIASGDVEYVLNQHPRVVDSAVVAVPSDARAHEDEIKACIVPAGEGALTAEELLEWCEARLPSDAVPRYVEFLAELPKTPTAKVRKDVLRAAGVTESTYDRGPRRRRVISGGVRQ